MSPIKKVAIFGASGNFGNPITAALLAANFQVTIITRASSSSSSSFPPGIAAIIRTAASPPYTDEAELVAALSGQDAVVSVLGPGAVAAQPVLVAAAHAAGVRRFVLDDFGWGPDFRSYPEFEPVGAARRVAWDKAREMSEEDEHFSWTGVAIGNPIDWALKRFPPMGFDIPNRVATIYDAGTERFTGTTLEGIAQAVVGVLLKPDQTANRTVRVRSIETCQAELLAGFQQHFQQQLQQQVAKVLTPGEEKEKKWTVNREAIADVLDRGRKRHAAGEKGWVLDLAVAQLFEVGKGRCVLCSREESDGELLGVREESVEDVVAKVMKM